MSNHIEINCPKAYKTYNGKRVLFFRMIGKRSVLTEGKFLVGGNSKWMQIDWIVTFTGAKMVVEHIPVSQEILQNIQPAPQTVLDAFDAQIPFVIPTPAISSCSP